MMTRMKRRETPWRMEADFCFDPPSMVAPREEKSAKTPARWRTLRRRRSMGGAFAD